MKKSHFPNAQRFHYIGLKSNSYFKSIAVAWLSEEQRALSFLPTRLTPHQNHKLNGNDKI